MPEGYQDHRCIAVSPAVALHGLDQPPDLALGSDAPAIDIRRWVCAWAIWLAPIAL